VPCGSCRLKCHGYCAARVASGKASVCRDPTPLSLSEALHNYETFSPGERSDSLPLCGNTLCPRSRRRARCLGSEPNPINSGCWTSEPWHGALSWQPHLLGLLQGAVVPLWLQRSTAALSRTSVRPSSDSASRVPSPAAGEALARYQNGAAPGVPRPDTIPTGRLGLSALQQPGAAPLDQEPI